MKRKISAALSMALLATVAGSTAAMSVAEKAGASSEGVEAWGQEIVSPLFAECVPRRGRKCGNSQ